MNETNDDPALLTVDDCIRLAAHRGVTLWTGTSAAGHMYITNGKRKYALPPGYFSGDGLPSSYVESLCWRFDLPRLDFALDPRDDN